MKVHSGREEAVKETVTILQEYHIRLLGFVLSVSVLKLVAFNWQIQI